tara:strand:+ start:130 stop:285 length:156 start_codon:yes stop_codon:yes gene_type:complete
MKLFLMFVVIILVNGCKLTIPFDVKNLFWTQEDLMNQERELDYNRNSSKTE